MRDSGVLLHITSLPSTGGIGSLGKEAYQFVNNMKKSGLSIWQVLPIGPTGYGESPYQSPSTFAGNPLLISIEKLCDDGFLTKDALSLQYIPDDSSVVNYDKVKENKTKLLKMCFNQSFNRLSEQIRTFRKFNEWVEDYALFIAVKEYFNNEMWTRWPDKGIRFRSKESVSAYKARLKDEIDYHIFVQYLFDVQWTQLKEYCNINSIQIFGDIPIYVAEDSSDTWTHPEIFQLDRNRVPKRVAGVPPDLFSQDGQLWGNPLYRWKKLRLNGYKWWVDRMKSLAKRYDIIRIDHFIGFANYYSIKYGSPNARDGKWIVGPQHHLFKKLNKEIPGLNIVAEDLGCVNDRVQKLLKYCGYPGMKVLSFAFGGNHDDNPHFPSNFVQNCVAYSGTHDNDTVYGLVEKMDDNTLKDAKSTLDFTNAADAPWAFIEYLFNSIPDRVVIPMQDFLSLNGTARMNLPGTTGGNWMWRMSSDAFSDDLCNRIRELNIKTNRGGKTK